jgi:hypothetical protein
MSGSKTPTILALAALLVAVLAATPVGQAAGRMILPKSSVGAPQIKMRAVTGPKIRKNAVTSAKVKNGTLLAADFKPGQLPAGPKGDPGPQGPKGDQGLKGDPGATRVTMRIGNGSGAGPGQSSLAQANCQAGETLVGGGGWFTTTSGAEGYWFGNSPNNTGNGWYVQVQNTGQGGYVYTQAKALCASP